MLLTSCSSLTGKKATTTTTTPTTTTATQALQDRIAATESRIAGLESQGNSTKTDVDSLLDRLTVLEGQSGGVDNSAEIADLQDQIDDLYATIDELENEPSSPSDFTTGEPIRWRLNDPKLYSYSTDTEFTGASLFTDVQADDPRLDEEGTYYLDLIIRNTSTTDPIPLHTFYIKFTMVPYTGEYALLSEEKTYLDTDTVWVSDGTSLAEPGWYASYDVRDRDGDITKKVTFESEKCANSSFELGTEETIKMTLYLELYYAD